MKKKNKLIFKKIYRIISIVVTVFAFIQVLYWVYVGLFEVLSWFIKFGLHAKLFYLNA